MIEAENVLIGELGKAVEYVYPETLEKSITANGEYNASDDNTYGYSKVNVSVQPPAPTLQSKETTPTTETQTITYDEGYDGLGQVQVNPIPSEYIIPTGTVNITENGTIDVTNYASANVTTSVAPNFVSFYGYTGSTLDVSWINTSNATSMYYMFASCTNLTELDLSDFNTSNVTNMNGMFRSCSKLASINVSNFDVSKVTDMSQMFQYCSQLTTLDLRNFTSKSGGTYTYMLGGCSRLNTLYLNNFDFRNISDVPTMMSNNVPKNCHIYVLDQYAKDALETANYTNVEIAS